MCRTAKMHLALAGASGSGKTYSPLLIAYGMTGNWSKIAVIDSDNCSADLYAHLGSYQILTLDNYTPEASLDRSPNAKNLIDDIGQAFDSDSEYCWFIE
jgi:CO dehydrogenase nickel-insertion accessory protein CooC1